MPNDDDDDECIRSIMEEAIIGCHFGKGDERQTLMFVL